MMICVLDCLLRVPIPCWEDNEVGGGQRGGGAGKVAFTRFFQSFPNNHRSCYSFWVFTQEKGFPCQAILIRERCFSFCFHEIVMRHPFQSNDPRSLDVSHLTLYHGFWSSLGALFCVRSISLPQSWNEFHSGPTFYHDQSYSACIQALFAPTSASVCWWHYMFLTC